MLALARRLTPSLLKTTLKAVIPYYRRRYCPLCKHYSARFFPYGNPPRSKARCIRCGALERHRFVWLFLERQTNLFDGRPKRLLHIAPELQLWANLRRVPGIDYLSADLMDPSAMVRMDITQIPYGNESFDVIFCSHVLEHIPDDRKAMREMCRVLRRTGWAMLIVPITAAKTFEDLTITDPEGRLRAFGQHDHVRRYGLDFEHRLTEAGFRVRTVHAAETGSPAERKLMGIPDSACPLFFCTKQ